MKKLILKLSILLALTIALASSATSQTQTSNTAPGNDPSTVSTDQTVSFLLDQNEKAKALIAAQEKRIADLEAESTAEKENAVSLSKSYLAAQSEIGSLRSANEALHKAVALNEQTISLLTTDRDKWKDEAHKQKKAKYKAYILAGSIIALKFLIP
jgi:uncharacterized lipoprotein YajG